MVLIDDCELGLVSCIWHVLKNMLRNTCQFSRMHRYMGKVAAIPGLYWSSRKSPGRPTLTSTL